MNADKKEDGAMKMDETKREEGDAVQLELFRSDDPRAAATARPVAAAKTAPERKRSRRKRGPGITAQVALGLSLVMAITLPARSVSLWSQGNGAGLFDAGKRAFKVGDIITIRVQEATNAAENWKSERNKEVKAQGTAAPTGNGAGTQNLFGTFVPFIDLDYKGDIKSDNKSNRNTTLTATVAATVLNILPNGNLQILARKTTRVNSEEQLVELTGNIRPEDVGADNTVSSTAVSDASIKVNGTLRYSNDEHPSIVERIFSFVTGIFW